MANYKEIAEKIVKELKGIIGKDFNYIDTDGKIIASTDPKRVGTYHEGGYIAAKKKKIIIIKEDDEYAGSKKGVNLPVIFKGKIISVIGISGNYEEVKQYGNIIKKMTEILIKEAYMSEKLVNEDEYMKIIMNDLIYNKTDEKNSITLNSEEFKNVKKADELTVFSAQYKGKETEFWEYKRKILETMREHSRKGELFINKDFFFIGILLHRDEKSINRFFKNIQDTLEIEFQIGIGNSKMNFKKLPDSYNEAVKALKWAKNIKRDKIFYNSMRFGLLLYDVSEEKKREFLKNMFKNVTEEEIKNFKQIFHYYEKYNGSIKEISKVMFLHKNTLQYQIIKFSEKTGLDIRKYRDFAVLKLAFFLY